MKRFYVQAIAATAALCATATIAIAQQQPRPDDVIKFRKGAFSVIGWYNGQLGQMVKGQRPFDAAVFARNAEIIAEMSRVVPDAFIPGSEKGETRARPEIFSQPDKFKVAMDRFQGEAAKLSEVAKGGNADQMRAQFGALVKSCAGCHDNFRVK